MEHIPRHQCMVYDGSPAKMLPAIAAKLKQKLDEHYRCIYLNSPSMVAGIKSYLYEAGINVAAEIERTSLILTSESHTSKGVFNIDQMLLTLQAALQGALADGFEGLWATGDMTWELGGDKDKRRLLEYERRLEEFFQAHPRMSGICQYHVDTLPRDILYHGLMAHPALFINETLSRFNPHYAPPDEQNGHATSGRNIDQAIQDLCALQPNG